MRDSREPDNRNGQAHAGMRWRGVASKGGGEATTTSLRLRNCPEDCWRGDRNPGRRRWCGTAAREALRARTGPGRWTAEKEAGPTRPLAPGREGPPKPERRGSGRFLPPPRQRGRGVVARSATADAGGGLRGGRHHPGGPWDLCAFHDEGDTLSLSPCIEVKSSKVKWGCKPLTPEEEAFRDYCIATSGRGVLRSLVRLQRLPGRLQAAPALLSLLSPAGGTGHRA